MSFLLPFGLLALLTLPLIVVLHLIRERRRRMVVPSLLNWRNLPRPKEGRRLNRLPLTLLLLMQLLIAALLALAIARPQLVGGPLQRASQTVIVIDASTSMAARDGASTRFEQARERARAVIRSMASGDRVTLVAAGPQARVTASGSAAELAALEQSLNELRAGGTVADLDGALALAESALDPHMPGRILMLTDGSTPPPANRTTAAPVEWQQIGGSPTNRAILAFAARPAGGKTQVYARVANYGDAPFDGMLRLFADDQPIDSRPVRIEANAEAEQTWTLPAGGSQLHLALDGGDALSQDDDAYTSLATTRPLKVALVSATPDPLQRALAAVSGVSVAVIPPDNYSTKAADADVTVFDSFLPAAWPNGAALVVHPPQGNVLVPVRSDKEVTGANLNQQGALVNGLGFGGVNFGSPRVVESSDGMATLLGADDVPLILRGRVDNHELAVWTFDVHKSNISTRLAFPLLVARTIRDLAPTALPSSIQSGSSLTMRPNAGATTVEVVSPDGATQQVASGASVTLEGLTQPGWYDIIERGATGELFRGRVAVNAGTPLESNLRQEPAPVLNNASSAGVGAQARQITDLWPWIALIALLGLAAEWLYVHRPVRRTSS